MHQNRKTAIIAGVLLITALVVNLLSLPFIAPINAANYLVEVTANGTQVITGALLAIIAAAASVSIAISPYPILKRYNEGLTLGAVGFRLIEGVFYILGLICLLVLLTLSQEFVKASTPASSYYQTFGVLLLAGYHWVGNVGAVLPFYIGALLYYSIFYQTKLVPRWLAGWGLVGAALGIVASLFVMFSLITPLSTPQVVLNLPIALQEMVLAIWLIVRGFNSSAIATLSAKIA